MQKASEMKIIRLRRGMSQRELGKKVGVNQTTISHIEIARYGTTLATRRKIARILKTSVEGLFPDLAKNDSRPSVKGRNENGT